jgi:DNA-binding NarL/FixJ family response regulator
MPESVEKRRPRIFLAEDDHAMRSLLRSALVRDYEVIESATGASLFSALWEAHVRGEAPALVISDIRMPGMSGVEALRAARAWGWKVPILFVTAFPDDETIAKTLELAPAAIFGKPLDVDDVRRAAAVLVAGNSRLPSGAGTAEALLSSESDRDEKP